MQVLENLLSKTIWTIGHSTLDWSVFRGLLRDNGLQTLVDVRTAPNSSGSSRFDQKRMTSVLTADAIAYIWMESLGGRRQPSPNSINTGWRDDAFRGYADHMQTPIFKNALAELEKLATHQATVLMCAETDWVKCHRSLISDALKAKGWDVWHITPSSVQPHLYTRVARVEGGQLSYSEERFL